MKKIQNELLKPELQNEDKLITIKSNGVNINHSVISAKNCTSQTYIYNLKIENACTENMEIDFSEYEFSESSDVIIYWPLEKNFVPQIVNTKYLSDDYSYILNSQKVKTGVSGDYITEQAAAHVSPKFYPISAQILNIDPAQMTDPGFMWLDKHFEINQDNSEKVESNIIKDIIYNKNGNTANTTLVFWGYQTMTDNNNNPIISDFNYTNGNGIFVSPEVVINSDKNNISTDARETFVTDFATYENKLLNNWVMYTIEFQNSGGNNPADDNILGSMSPWNTQPWNITPAENNMRINIRATFLDMNSDNTNPQTVLLLPNADQIRAEQDNQFKKPDREINVNLDLFGVKRYNIASSNNMNGWSVWNGAVRNLMIFNGFLSTAKIINLFKKYIPEYYAWLDENEYDTIKQIDNNSYFGSVYCKNMHAISIVGSVLKQNTQTLNLIFKNKK